MQPEFDFDPLPGRNADGVSLWQSERAAHQLEMAKRLGLPIGHGVEVWLRGGIRLKGKLVFAEESLVHNEVRTGLRLQIDSTIFSGDELESCIKL